MEVFDMFLLSYLPWNVFVCRHRCMEIPLPVLYNQKRQLSLTLQFGFLFSHLKADDDIDITWPMCVDCNVVLLSPPLPSTELHIHMCIYLEVALQFKAHVLHVSTYTYVYIINPSIHLPHHHSAPVYTNTSSYHLILCIHVHNWWWRWYSTFWVVVQVDLKLECIVLSSSEKHPWMLTENQTIILYVVPVCTWTLFSPT